MTPRFGSSSIEWALPKRPQHECVAECRGHLATRMLKIDLVISFLWLLRHFLRIDGLEVAGVDVRAQRAIHTLCCW
jgi:hypothetical protein